MFSHLNSFLMKKFGRKKNGKGPRKSRGVGFKQLTARMSGIEDTLYVQENSGAAGRLAPATSSVFVTSDGVAMPLVARNMGSRLSQLAGNYNQWKFNYLRFRYTPASYQGGYLSNDLASVPGNYPLISDEKNITSRMVGGFVLDPTVRSLSFSELVQTGGKVFNPARPFTWTLGSSKWLYINAIEGESATGSPERWISMGNFMIVGNALGTTSPNNRYFGTIELEWDCSFRYPLDADAVEMSQKVHPMREYLAFEKEKAEEKRRSEEYEPLLLPSGVTCPIPSTPRPQKLKVDVGKLFSKPK